MSRHALPVIGRRDLSVSAPSSDGSWTSFLAEDPGAAPALSFDDEAAGNDELLALLGATLNALRDGDGALFQIPDLERWALVQRTLGRGEVEGEVSGRHRYGFWETALPGVWSVETRDEDGTVQSTHLEIGTIPEVVVAASEAAPRRQLPWADTTAAGLMNGPALLAEIHHHMNEVRDARPGQTSHVISFSQLPLTAEDVALIDAVLGRGPIQMMSRGYGTCRVQLTGVRHVWSVQHFNANGALILDTLEIGGVPRAVLAAPEDSEDAANRLAELLDTGVSP